MLGLAFVVWCFVCFGCFGCGFMIWACGLFCCDLMLGFAWLVWFVCLLFSFAWFEVLGLLLVVILLFLVIG